MARRSGYSPSVWVLGSAGPCLPGGVLDADEAAKLEVLGAAEDPLSEMGRALALRESARQAFTKLDRAPPQE
eukprot:12308786-Alexandrium_andersonii.AAC.1